MFIIFLTGRNFQAYRYCTGVTTEAQHGKSKSKALHFVVLFFIEISDSSIFQLTEENEGLHETLKSSQENQKDLKVEVTTLHEKYQECYEMLMENQVRCSARRFLVFECMPI